MIRAKQTLLTTQTSIHSSALLNTTVLFLLAAPIAIIIYGSFVFNPKNADNIILYIIQLIADSISIIVLLSLWLTILLDVLVEQHHRKNNAHDSSVVFSKKPSVDVLITVAGEPIEIVRKTAEAVVALHYPHTTFLLDDGRSSEVQKLAKKLGITYVTRGDRSFNKSGNINNGLKFCSGDFFAIFDADQVPSSDFLLKLMPYMANTEIAMVQSPQSFRNTHEFIANGTAQAQEIFYKHICPAKNISNSAFCVGTNVIFRRRAIDEIGGVASLGHSEDIYTSLSLHEKGYKTIFVNEILALGEAPNTIHSLFKQQLRWAEGGLSMMFFRNPLTSSKLNLDQKLQYFSANFFYLVGIPILAYLLFPIIYLFFELKSLQTESGVIWLLHYLPYVGVYYLLTWLLLGKIHISTIATSLANFFPYLLALVSVVFGTKNTWIATTTRRSSTVQMAWIWPHVLIVILTIFALIVGWYNPTKFWVTTYNSCWALFNLYLLVIFITGERRKGV